MFDMLFRIENLYKYGLKISEVQVWLKDSNLRKFDNS